MHAGFYQDMGGRRGSQGGPPHKRLLTPCLDGMVGLITNKSTGGRVCFYVTKRYCITVIVQESPKIFSTFLYIYPRTNTSSATQLITEVTNRVDALSCDTPKFILGDFNHCQIHKTLKTYEQCVTCATTEKNSKPVCVMAQFLELLDLCPCLVLVHPIIVYF